MATEKQAADMCATLQWIAGFAAVMRDQTKGASLISNINHGFREIAARAKAMADAVDPPPEKPDHSHHCRLHSCEGC